MHTLGQRRDGEEMGGFEQKNSKIWLFWEEEGRQQDLCEEPHLAGGSGGPGRVEKGAGKVPGDGGPQTGEHGLYA